MPWITTTQPFKSTELSSEERNVLELIPASFAEVLCGLGVVKAMLYTTYSDAVFVRNIFAWIGFGDFGYHSRPKRKPIPALANTESRMYLTRIAGGGLAVLMAERMRSMLSMIFSTLARSGGCLCSIKCPRTSCMVLFRSRSSKSAICVMVDQKEGAPVISALCSIRAAKTPHSYGLTLARPPGSEGELCHGESNGNRG